MVGIAVAENESRIDSLKHRDDIIRADITCMDDEVDLPLPEDLNGFTGHVRIIMRVRKNPDPHWKPPGAFSPGARLPELHRPQ